MRTFKIQDLQCKRYGYFIHSFISNCSIKPEPADLLIKLKLPPGQAKKIYGGKSAKRYAPDTTKIIKKDLFKFGTGLFFI
jgi:hypothetical protein